MLQHVFCNFYEVNLGDFNRPLLQKWLAWRIFDFKSLDHEFGNDFHNRITGLQNEKLAGIVYISGVFFAAASLLLILHLFASVHNAGSWTLSVDKNGDHSASSG